MTGLPALSNVVMPENSTDPSQTSSNAPHETEPEYVNESANRSGGFAEAVPATSSATPQVVAAAVRSLVMPAFPCSPPGLTPRTRNHDVGRLTTGALGLQARGETVTHRGPGSQSPRRIPTKAMTA